MLYDVLRRILDTYATSREQQFGQHPLAHYIRYDVPLILEQYLSDYPEFRIVASAGKGRWADAPWIAIFDPLVTDTAQIGYYPVYLFTQSLDHVYLSLNQGMTLLREDLGTALAKVTLRQRASIIRQRLQSSIERRFMVEQIDLQPPSSGSRLAFYEPGHAFGTKYSAESLPSESKLVEDFLYVVELYQRVTALGGTDTFDAPHSIGIHLSEEENISLEEKRRLRLHFVVERNQRLVDLAKKYHGFRCQVCEFGFGQVYGSLGQGYIEAHHLTPLSELVLC
jgi:5-methylcytosine-specific restriction enzyme A